MCTSNRFGQAGFLMSLMAICGVFAAGPFGEPVTLVGTGLAFLALPGIVLSAIGLRRSPRRLAAWGLIIGLVGALYLPTFSLALLRR